MRASSPSRFGASIPQKMPQDMPPRSGYEPVQYKRNLPARGFRPLWYAVGMGAVMSYGFYKLTIGIREWNELSREKTWARIHLVPLLQAEEDRDQVRRYWADKDREKQLLGTDTNVYNSDRYVYLSDGNDIKFQFRSTYVLDHTSTYQRLTL